ncbi:putative cytoplasmic protein [endosymbiont of Acanthamoeba sp. UWC8]|nr:cell cycle transcriptional regulator TrcR [Candidatus Jidaibacter acanthamoeba]AIF80809.1 putative cytoplasmic protein [endosymbiont of Acanthamoeba sp. UWC8]
MTKPLMPKATAIWLIENTTLTFGQIAEFCGLHPLEVQGIADGDVAKGIIGIDPVTSGQITKEEITRCETNPKLYLTLSANAQKLMKEQARQKKSAKYTPVARRQDKPDAVAWIIKNCPELNDSQIMKLIGTTKTTINAVRDKSHWNSPNIRPRDPVLLGLCTQTELDRIYDLAKQKSVQKAQEEKSEAMRKLEE